jgi:hypothetical protein
MIDGWTQDRVRPASRLGVKVARARLRGSLLACACALLIALPGAQGLPLGAAREVAPGVRLFHVTDSSLIEPAGPLSIWLLRLDPDRVRVRPALANDEIMGTETVAAIADRHHALAAINAGFFLPNGDPAGVLAIENRLVSDTRRPRGAVGILAAPGRVRLIFARLRATMTLQIGPRTAHPVDVPIDGVDTTRQLGHVMLFTPAYHAHTDTVAGGREWTLDGAPLRVVGGVNAGGKTPIPRTGYVVSYGGTTIPPGLSKLTRGTRVALRTTYVPVEGSADDWTSASHIVGGAGLLLRNGERIDDWSIEQFNPGFAEMRHPRTMIGTTADGTIWMAVVDGRQPQLSSGMTLEELRRLAMRLALTNALNLDGGGSTTIWVQGQVVNSPSDVTGPRKVSDALLVYGTTGQDAERSREP